MPQHVGGPCLYWTPLACKLIKHNVLSIVMIGYAADPVLICLILFSQQYMESLWLA